MSIFSAVRGILQATSAITDEVSTRVYIRSAFTGDALPYIVMDASMIENTYSKDRTSPVDTYSVLLEIFHNTADEAIALGELCRTALLGYAGTVNSQEVQDCYLDSEDSTEYEIDGQLVPGWQQEYQITIVRS